MKQRIIWSILLFSLLATSCLEKPYTPVVPVDENFFDWKTVSTLNLDVKVDAMSESLNNYCRTVNVYSSPLFDKGSLMVSGASLPDKPFEYKLILPTSLNKVYVEIVYPDGVIKQYVQNISAETSVISVDTRVSTKADEGIQTPEIDVPEWGPVPTSFDVTINRDFGWMSLSGNKTYYVPAGADVSGPLSCSNYGWNTYAVLYIAGKLTIEGDASMVRSSIVVLDGGELIIEGSLSTYGYAPSSRPALYVMEGGKVSIVPSFNFSYDIDLEGSNSMVNKGEIIVAGSRISYGAINMSNGSPVLYNTGTIRSNDDSGYGDIVFSVNNNASIYNDGIIKASEIDLSNYSSITNYANGNILVDEYYQGNRTNLITNYGKVDAGHMEIHGTVDNYGYVGVGDVEDPASSTDLYLLDNSTFYNHDGSLLQADVATLKNSTINMGEGSIVSLNTLKVNSSGYLIKNNDDAYSLLIINESLSLQRGCAINGDVEVWHKNLGSSGNDLEKDYKNKYSEEVIWVKNLEERVTNIPANEYNKGLGEITPPAPVDADGDGVMSDTDIDDNDPTIAYRSYFPNNTEYGTILVEDLWPYTGDYDMNDAVCDYHIEWTSNAQNQLVYMEYFWKLRAVGSTKKIAMAVQLDSIPVSSVSSVTSTHTIVGDLPLSAVNGLESGQAFPVIPLFNDPNELFPVSTLINTTPDYPLYPVNTNSFKVVFTEPVNPSYVSLNRINPFIVVTDFDNPTRNWEIHMPGFKRTARASAVLNNPNGLSQADPYLSNTGMMWMIRLPKSIGYTIETYNIENAYTHYRLWYESKGQNYTDWYISPIDETQIYHHND